MKVARYWARAEAVGRDRRGHSFDLLKYGWSDRSMAEAEQRARRGVEDLAARLGSGEGFPDHYGYGEGSPLREEVVRTHGTSGADDEAVITRNSYGALVLNAARVLFVDIDLPGGKGSSPTGGGLVGFFGKLFGSKAAAASPAAGPEPALTPEEEVALERVRAWTQRNRDWNFRVYRTAAGLRLLATHAPFDPKDRETQTAMEALGADPLYVRLCRAQECFRARLTPKPWRVGMRPPAMRFPYADRSQQEAMTAWLSQYDRSRSQAATCRLLRTLGSGETTNAVAGIVRLHDEEARVAHGPMLRLA
jgi:hypothetical protein